MDTKIESAQKADPGEENSAALAEAQNLQPFDHETGTLTTEPSPLPNYEPLTPPSLLSTPLFLPPPPPPTQPPTCLMGAMLSPGQFSSMMVLAQARPKTTRSSRELAPRRLAPWTEALAASPAAYRPGTTSSPFSLVCRTTCELAERRPSVDTSRTLQIN